jgi:hypothetical protein
VDWLIRSAHNRKLAGEQDKLWQGFGEQHVLGDISFTLPARKGERARQVRQQVSARRCTLRSAKGEPIEVTALLAQEVDAADGVKPIHCLAAAHQPPRPDAGSGCRTD